jgi:hypothetical protein
MRSIIRSGIAFVMNRNRYKNLSFFNSKNRFSNQIILAFDVKIMYF